MPRARSVSRSDDAVITNAEMARVLTEVGDMLEILGEVVYKAVAYRRVADAVARHPEDVSALFRRGRPPVIPGAGPALNARLAELAQTGRLEYHAALRAQVPDGLLDMLRLPGIGPKTARVVHAELGIDSVDALRAAAEEGRLRHVRGLSARSEAGILEAIRRVQRPGSERMLIHDADALFARLAVRLREVPGVMRLEAAGSVRRRCPTIGDLDILVATEEPAAIIAALMGLPEVDQVLSSGADGSRVTLHDGPTLELVTCTPATWGSHLFALTGSHDHVAALRRYARDRGRTLSERGLRVDDTGELLAVAEEAELYECLGLPWIAPELREADGELEAAMAGRLPDLVTHDDVRGDTHTHSDWTDGVDSIEAMARAARRRGLEYIVLTDHSPSLGVARGLSPARVEEQRSEIDRLNRELAPFRILHGTELEIRADGALDYDEEVLARFEVVIASIHTGRGQAPDQLTSRALAAIESPHVDVIAHPSGRIVNRRDPLPLDWGRVFEAAARTGTALEINGSPRLDLDDVLARVAGRVGATLTVASDAHRTEELDQQRHAVDLARRAWLTRDQLLATRSAGELLERLA